MLYPKTKRSAYLNLIQAKLIPFADNCFNRMSTNDRYLALVALYTLLNERTIAFTNALAAASEGGTVFTAAKNVAKRELIEVLNKISDALDEGANGDAMFILEAGMKEQKKKGQGTIVEEEGKTLGLSNVVASTTLQPGKVKVTYDLEKMPRMIGVAGEWVEVDKLAEANWTNGTYFGKNAKKGEMVNLPSMKEVYLRLRVICEEMKHGPWTEPIRVKVL